jgi:protein-lysine N-methyltransferase EEF2KMT
MGELSSLLAVRMPPEALAVQDKSYVTYTFTKDDESLPVTMLESRAVISSSGTTGLRTWEAALHLGAFLRSTEGQRFVKGKQMLELGAGTGLVSLLCAKHLGAQHVMATDGSELVVDAIRSNIFLNGLDNGGVVEAAALKWGYALSDESIEEDYNNGTLDVVVGADVVC